MIVQIHHGDCLEVLDTLEAESVHAVVTDPPYHLTAGKRDGSGEASVNLDSPHGRARITAGFMGQKWDGGDVAFQAETWRKVLRVMKPGAYLLAFGGTRTYHRLACAIEDAGFEVRDMVSWLYGSGFPKGTDKAKIPAEWQGFNTALKPALEPICLARKPMTGTLAENLQAHGCGVLNIDGCRIEGESTLRDCNAGTGNSENWRTGNEAGTHGSDLGRWPANVVHDGSEEVLARFPVVASGDGAVKRQSSADARGNTGAAFGAESRAAGTPMVCYGDEGSAARFFYCAKADREDRNDGLHGMAAKPLNWPSGEQNPGAFQSPNTNRTAQNHHPTVKPTDLMVWLCKLVTPPGGTILDPFMGSGSTGRGALLGDFGFIGIEAEREYIEIADRRIRAIAPLLVRTEVHARGGV